MKKNIISQKTKEKDFTKLRQLHYTFVLNKYFNLFLNDYEFTELDYQQNIFILTRLWSDGTISAFPLKNTKGAKDHPQGVMVFTPYNPSIYNIYGFTIWAIPVNLRGVKFIPTKPLKVNEEIVLGWAQKNRKSIKSVVDYYAQKIADIEMVIYMNLQVQKTPWIIGVSPESRVKMEQFVNKIFDDNPALAIDLDDIQYAKALVSGAPYVIDKLKMYLNELYNELDEYFGYSNLGVMEKKEHLVNEEVRSNNEKTELLGNTIEDCIKEFADRIKEVFDYDVGFRRKHQEETKPIDTEEEEVQTDE